MKRYDDRPVKNDRNSFGYGHTRLTRDERPNMPWFGWVALALFFAFAILMQLPEVGV